MPHVIIEYSNNIEQDHDVQALCDTIFSALSAHPTVSSPATLKIRAHGFAYSRIGTEPQSFVHATIRVLPGRDADTKADLTQTTLDVLTSALPNVGSLTVDIADLDPAYAKRTL